MQTFLPYPDFQKTAQCLDYKRLGKQRLEAKQIISLLEKYDNGEDISKLPWSHHPIINLWKGYTKALKRYYNVIVMTWEERGYKNNMLLYWLSFDELDNMKYPPWFGSKEFHDAHKSKLLQKDPEYYSKFNWNVPLNLEYKWQIKNTQEDDSK
jgi:hypothetical protein